MFNTFDATVNDSTAIQSAILPRTPGLVLGPYYPLALLATPPADLWACEPLGRRIDVQGFLRTCDGEAVADAEIEVWHADPHGQYRHPSAPNASKLPTEFNGFARIKSADDGSYVLRTNQPGAYTEGLLQRAPHIHFQITDHHDRLITQMFFPDDPLNPTDHWLGASRRPEALLARVVRDTPACLFLRWDIVLSRR